MTTWWRHCLDTGDVESRAWGAQWTGSGKGFGTLSPELMKSCRIRRPAGTLNGDLTQCASTTTSVENGWRKEPPQSVSSLPAQAVKTRLRQGRDRQDLTAKDVAGPFGPVRPSPPSAQPPRMPASYGYRSATTVAPDTAEPDRRPKSGRRLQSPHTFCHPNHCCRRSHIQGEHKTRSTTCAKFAQHPGKT
jgi:hypothetical protein